MVFVLSCVPPLGVLQLSRTKFQSPPAAKPLFTGVFLRAFFQALARERVPKGRPVQQTLRRPTIGFNGVFSAKPGRPNGRTLCPVDGMIR